MEYLKNLDLVFSQGSKALLKQCATTEWLTQYLTTRLNDESLTLGDVQHKLQIIEENQHLVLRSSLISPQDSVSQHVTLSERDCLLVVFGGAEVQVDYYTDSTPNADSYNKTLVLSDSILYQDGDFIELKKGVTFYKITYKKAGVIVSLVGKSSIPEIFKFDPSSGKLANVSASEMLYSKLDFACNLLAKFPREQSLPVLDKLIAHDVHYIRWSAMQAFAQIAKPEDTKAALTKLKDDPHPHIRNAVNYSLTHLFREQQ